MVTMVMSKESGMHVISCDVVILSIQIKQLSWQLSSCKASLEQTSERDAASEAVLTL